ncbi:MAG: anti-sigma factor [Steroidobacteraceae bacterium]
MNYNHPQLLDHLAAAYVLGVMSRRVRLRFERLCRTLPQAQLARQQWEDRLLPLALALAPVEPSTACWQRIQQKVSSRPQRGRMRWWPAAAAASLLAVLLVGKLTLWNEPAWQDIAILAAADAPPMWRLESTADRARISVRRVGTGALQAGRSYELWILPDDGSNPVSLGLLPASGDLQRKLSAAQQALLGAAGKVAVSVEPPGGSPTGLPTGPVIIVAEVQRPI